MLIILESALGCFTALVLYRWLFGSPGGASDAQLHWLAAKLGELEELIQERLPDASDDDLDELP